MKCFVVTLIAAFALQGISAAPPLLAHNATPEEEVKSLQKQVKTIENELNKTKEALEAANAQLEAKDIALKNAESDIASLNRRIQLLEEDLESLEQRLVSAAAHLSERERAIKALESRALTDEERIDTLQNQLTEARFLTEEADKKYDEKQTVARWAGRFVNENSVDRRPQSGAPRMLDAQARADVLQEIIVNPFTNGAIVGRQYQAARKLAKVEADLASAEDRLEAGESKIVELEEELRVVTKKLKVLEVAEEKAIQREEEDKTQIETLTTRIKEITMKCSKD